MRHMFLALLLNSSSATACVDDLVARGIELAVNYSAYTRPEVLPEYVVVEPAMFNTTLGCDNCVVKYKLYIGATYNWDGVIFITSNIKNLCDNQADRDIGAVLLAHESYHYFQDYYGYNLVAAYEVDIEEFKKTQNCWDKQKIEIEAYLLQQKILYALGRRPAIMGGAYPSLNCGSK